MKKIPLDQAAAKALLSQGANINAKGKYPDDYLLSELLWEYGFIDETKLDKPLGEYLLDMLRFALDNGLDLSVDDGAYGSECLCALRFLYKTDEYILEAAKLLLDAGIRQVADTNGEEPRGCIATEASFFRVCEHVFPLANLFETLFLILDRAATGKEYRNIYAYSSAIGKSITEITASGDQPIQPTEYKNEKKEYTHFFQNNISIWFGNERLCINKYSDIWCEKFQNDIPLKAESSVSELFQDCLGTIITRISFDYHEVQDATTCFTIPEVTLVLDNGKRISFSSDYGPQSRNTENGCFVIEERK